MTAPTTGILSAETRAESPFTRFASYPEASGLYSPENEKDACGLAVIATLRGEPGHDIVDAALTALRNLEHRGAVGADRRATGGVAGPAARPAGEGGV